MNLAPSKKIFIVVIATILFSISTFTVYSQDKNKPYKVSDLFRSVRSNDLERVEHILRNSDTGMVNSVISPESGITIMHVSAAMDHSSIIRVISLLGGSVNARTSGGFTPLHWAAGKDAINSVYALIELGADINASTKNGITPLHWASSRNATNTIKKLILSGANIESETEKTFTPLHWAVMKEASEASVLLAYKTASDQLEQEETYTNMKIEETLPHPVEAATPDTKEENMPSAKTEKQLTNLVVPLGMGEELTFLWIEQLKIWVGKYEITNGQFRRFNTQHNSLFYETFTLNGHDQPVVYISWNSSKAFCEWLTKNFADKIPLNSNFRLPTEEEWIKIARCGDNREFPWGNDWPPEYGNFSDFTGRKKLSNWTGIKHYDDGHAVTCPVIKSGSNEWGIYGLAGNVWEWCEDWYDSSKIYKVRHGGSWFFDGKSNLRIDQRGFDRPAARHDTIGFRVVIEPKESSN